MVFFFYAIFCPRPYELVFGILVFTPIVALISGCISTETLNIKSSRFNPNPMFGIFLFNSMPLVLWAWTRQIDSFVSLLPSCILLLVIVNTLIYFSGVLGDKESYWAIPIISCIYVFGVANEANEYFDNSVPVISKVEVKEKDIGGKSPPEIIVLDQNNIEIRFSKNRDFYHQVEVGTKLCMRNYSGFLGASYSTLHFCD